MNIPRHIAIIMDGNSRWAKERGFSKREGHRAGVEAMRRTVQSAMDLGVGYVTFYAFSMENWKRSKDEVDYLMNLIREFLKRESRNLRDKDIRLMFIGRREGLAADIVEKIRKVTEETAEKKKLTVVMAVNYGSRSEIADASKAVVNDVLDGKINVNDINEELFGRYLYTKDVPDPDLFIRTSGEMRLSNFLLWQLSYAELWITPVYWPDFNKDYLVKAIEDYNNRERRFGGRLNNA